MVRYMMNTVLTSSLVALFANAESVVPGTTSLRKFLRWWLVYSARTRRQCTEENGTIERFDERTRVGRRTRVRRNGQKWSMHDAHCTLGDG